MTRKRMQTMRALATRVMKTPTARTTARVTPMRMMRTARTKRPNRARKRRAGMPPTMLPPRRTRLTNPTRRRKPFGASWHDSNLRRRTL
jgi:hypothetical protein